MRKIEMTLPKISRTETAFEMIVAGQPELNRKIADMRRRLAEMFAEDGDTEGATRNLAAADRLMAKA